MTENSQPPRKRRPIADKWLPVSNIPSRQVHKSARLEPRPIGVQRPALMEMSTRRRQNYGSSKRDARDDDSDGIKGNYYPVRTEHFQGLPFFERRMGACH